MLPLQKMSDQHDELTAKLSMLRAPHCLQLLDEVQGVDHVEPMLAKRAYLRLNPQQEVARVQIRRTGTNFLPPRSS